MADFDPELKRVTSDDVEGGYVFDLDDPGGESYRGLARNRQPGWPGWLLIDAAKQRPGFPENLEADTALQVEVGTFYRALWRQFGLDEVDSQCLAGVIFDCAVNQGPSRATMFLQRAMNVTNNRATLWPDVKEDGHLGPETLSVMRCLKNRASIVAFYFVCFRGGHYANLAEKDSRKEKFITGWARRMMGKV
jgi:lysozyme family protein